MMRGDLIDALEVIADTLRINLEATLSKSVNRIDGTDTRDLLSNLIPGVSLIRDVKIVQSTVDTHIGVLSVLAHVAGNLYLAVVYDSRDHWVTVFVVNGSKLGWSRLKNSRVYVNMGTHIWTRRTFLREIVKGVVAAYHRKTTDDVVAWVQWPNARKAIEEYLQSKAACGGFKRVLKANGVAGISESDLVWEQ